MRNWLLSLLLLAAATPATAQQRLSLNDCLSLADSSNLKMRAARLAVERATDLQATAWDVDKTSITLSQDPTSGGSPDNALTVSQSIAFPTVYGARRRQLKAETALERSQLETVRTQVKRDVASAYYGLLYVMERRRILQKQANVYERFLQIATAKEKAGETGRLEWMNANRLKLENGIALSNAQTDVDIAAQTLQQCLATDFVVMPAEDSLTVMTLTPQSEFNPQSSANYAVAVAQRTVQERSLSVARQGFLPDITLSASTQMVLSGFNPYDVDRSRYDKGNFMGFEVGLSVPLFFGSQRAKVKAAKRSLEIADTQLKQQKQTLSRQYATAYEEYRKAKATLDYYQTTGAAQADEIERISQKAYENGEIGYVEYVQNLQTALDIHNAHAAAINSFNQATIKLIFNY